MSAHDLRPGRVLRARYSAADAPRAFAESPGIPGKAWISFEERTA
jgi:alcohol dehydrogenase/L-iditol 2-dehydrogenase